MESQNYHSQKSFGIKRIYKSFINSFNGLKEAYTTEQSLLIHLAVSIIAIILCIVLKQFLINQSQSIFLNKSWRICFTMLWLKRAARSDCASVKSTLAR